MNALKNNYDGIYGKTCQVVVRITLNKFYSEFAPEAKPKVPFFRGQTWFFIGHTWRHESTDA